MLDEPAMSQKYATGQKMTGTTATVGVEYRNLPANQTHPFDDEAQYEPVVAEGAFQR